MFEDGVQLDSFLVRPEHINFWRTPGWWDERQTLEFTACHVSESQMRKAFPHRW